MYKQPISERITNRKLKQIVKQLRRQGVVSKQDLLEQTGMTVSTLTRSLEELTADGIILESGLGPSTGGRRPILYRMNPTYAYAFGLEISRTLSRLVLTDMEMNVIDTATWSMGPEATPDELIKSVISTILNMKDRHRLETSMLLGLGIGAVGPLDRDTGTILTPLYFTAPGWRNVDICRRMEEGIGLPTLLDNGANTALLAESQANPLERSNHLLYLHVGVGLRSAVIAEGKLIYGAVDMEGAVGQMIIQSDGIPHRNPGGNYGCLESYATTYAVEQMAKSRLKQGRESCILEKAGTIEQVKFSHVIQSLRESDPLATEIIEQAGTYFGIGLANLLNILHPGQVILGGPLIASNDLYYRTASRVALQNTYYYPSYRVEFRKSAFGEEAMAIGAAAMIIEQLTTES